MTFRYKWMQTDSTFVELKKKDNLVFSIPKVLVEDEPIDVKARWVLRVLEKKVFLLFRKKEKIKNLRRSWREYSFSLTKNKGKIVFTLPKGLVEQKFLDDNWVLRRLDDNVFILFIHREEEKLKKFLKNE